MTHARRRKKTCTHLIAALAALAFALAGAPQGAAAADPPPNSVWSEHYFPSDDGLTMLHADVLRPADIAKGEKTPVILTVSPYVNHSGQTTDFNPSAAGPSDRFYDFLELSDIIDRGYTYVMVDLPGFGGSGGCNDWGGVREQGAAKAAVEWAASQPWSSGKVGMIGKSYDGWTGLMAMAQKPKGLAAVVSMEPVFAGYRYLYNNGVRFTNSVATPALFQGIDAKPGTVNDDPMYNVNGAPQAWCYGVNLALQQDDDPNSAFWQERDLLASAKGIRTPLFLTQGFLETNTKPDGAFEYFNSLAGPNQAWFGQFDHVRGWERDQDGRFLMGRSVFVAEMMRFLDHHLKGRPLGHDPSVAVQDALGRYRSEPSWPPPDARMLWNDLNEGSYTDDGTNSSAGGSAGTGIWSISQPLPYDAWLSGEPEIKLEVDALPRANVAVNVYDIAPGGRATMVSRGTWLVRGAGVQKISFPLYGQDWPLAAGHRIGILVSSANSDWWTHIPTRTTVTVTSARVGIPFLRFDRDRFIDGKATTRLRGHLESEYLELSKAETTDAATRWKLPDRLRAR